MVDLNHLDLAFLPEHPEGIYLVGGTVRDLLAGRPPKDMDLAVAGDVRRMAGGIAEKTGGRVIDLGKKGFDVIRVAGPDLTVDITPLAQASIEANLRQRDFTINAMAVDVKTRRLLDCTGGLADLQQKRIRMVSPAAFENDPARLVRAYRMAATFHFTISARTRDAIGACRHLVGTVAGERIWAELFNLFNAANASASLADMADSGLLTAIFPELRPAIGCTQNRHHQFDVFDHSLRVVGSLERLLSGPEGLSTDPQTVTRQVELSDRTAMLKYAALLHDVGKPAVRQVDPSGRVRFFGHAAESAAIAAGIGDRLKLSNRQRRVADALIRHHLRPLFLFLSSEKGCLGERGRVRFFNRCGRLTLPIIVHTMADIMAKAEVLGDRDQRFIRFSRRLVGAYQEYAARRASGPRLIDGNDLIAVFDLTPSPRFKFILKQVEERRLSAELTTRDQAIQWVRAHLSSETLS